MNDLQKKMSINWHKVFVYEEGEQLNFLEKFIRVFVILLALYFLYSLFFATGDLEFRWIEPDGTYHQFILEAKYVSILQKAVSNQELTEQEKQILKENVSRAEAERAFAILRKEWLENQGLTGISTNIASNVKAEEFVNQVYGYEW
jgi:hypothetical protein